MKSSLKITPITGSLGAIVEGLNLTKLDKQNLKTIKNSLDKFLVIKIPNQNLGRFQLSKLGSKFCSYFHHPIVPNGYKDCPEVLELLKNLKIPRSLAEKVGMQI